MAVIICGADMRTAHGSGRRETFAQMVDGVAAVGELRSLRADRYRSRYAYEIPDNPIGDVAQNRSTAWLLEVIAGAMREAQVDAESERVVVLIGTGLREQASLENWHVDGAPFSLADWDYAEAIKARFGAHLDVHVFVNACAATLCCLSLANSMLEVEEADAVIVAGTDSLTSSMYGLLDRVNGDPPDRIVPFDLDRKGVLMGEGAAAVVLRRKRMQTTPVLAQLVAAVQNCDARHETAPTSDSIVELVEFAHRTAAIQPDGIDLIIAHGTGTTLNDDTEARALAKTFGTAASGVMLAGVKGLIGHTAGPSGLISLITGIEIIRTGAVPPSVGLLRPIPDAACFDLVTELRRDQRVDRLQVNAFGFGGVNAVASIERPHVA